jgi:hypothetical protein
LQGFRIIVYALMPPATALAVSFFFCREDLSSGHQPLHVLLPEESRRRGITEVVRVLSVKA